jgi:hypothetical protein
VLEVADTTPGDRKCPQIHYGPGRHRPWVTEHKVDPSAVISPLAVVDEKVVSGQGRH